MFASLSAFASNIQNAVETSVTPALQQLKQNVKQIIDDEQKEFQNDEKQIETKKKQKQLQRGIHLIHIPNSHQHFIHLYLCFYLSMYLSIYLSIYLSFYLLIYLFIYALFISIIPIMVYLG